MIGTFKFKNKKENLHFLSLTFTKCDKLTIFFPLFRVFMVFKLFVFIVERCIIMIEIKYNYKKAFSILVHMIQYLSSWILTSVILFWPRIKPFCRKQPKNRPNSFSFASLKMRNSLEKYTFYNIPIMMLIESALHGKLAEQNIESCEVKRPVGNRPPSTRGEWNSQSGIG